MAKGKPTPKPSVNPLVLFWDKLFKDMKWQTVVTDKLHCRVYAPLELDPRTTSQDVDDGRWQIPFVLVTALTPSSGGVHLRQLRSEVINVDSYMLDLFKHYLSGKSLSTFKFHNYRTHRKGKTIRLATFKKWATEFGYTPLVYTNEESPYVSFVFGAKAFKASKPDKVIKQKGEPALLTLLSTFQVGADDVAHFHTVNMSRTVVKGIVTHVRMLLDVAVTRKADPTNTNERIVH